MKRYENQQARPTAGCLSVPLFNQKKRSRLPLTSNPSEKKFCSGNEYMPTHSSASSIINTSGNTGYYQDQAPRCPAPAAQDNQWSRQGNQQQSQPQSQCPNCQPVPSADGTATSEAGLKSPDKPQTEQLQCPLQQWEHTEQAGTPKQLLSDGSAATIETHIKLKIPLSQVQHVKPATENSLRILTAVIDGIRHWSHFKDRAPYLFEIFATLDSAVTAGSHGAKNFLMRDGKEVVQCVFYENELELPRLIRGQVHRCVGNYDCTRDTLTCVSVRAALPSEQRNAQESIKASDAEMRDLVKSLSEV
ncbi:spermatogenesis-associated protein 22-like [Salmo trutta]|uniref:spermatogenesis-associated protein 22-like n=1 Tax=Salmo trutta TaxID=8032 RepID=UPI001131C9BC|nr:spermatogenesis-associated protein 22-like [Salmo trutta]